MSNERTKEEILKPHFYNISTDTKYGPFWYVSYSDAAKCMQEFADLSTKELRDEVESLKDINEGWQKKYDFLKENDYQHYLKDVRALQSLCAKKDEEIKGLMERNEAGSLSYRLHYEEIQELKSKIEQLNWEIQCADVVISGADEANLETEKEATQLKAEIERLKVFERLNENKRDLMNKLEAQIQSLQSQLKEARELLRETVMRANFAMPEGEQDEKWFEQKIDIHNDNNFTERIFETLKLGKIDIEECGGAKCTIKDCPVCKNQMY